MLKNVSIKKGEVLISKFNFYFTTCLNPNHKVYKITLTTAKELGGRQKKQHIVRNF